MAQCRNEKPCWSDGVCRYSGDCINKIKTTSDDIRTKSDAELAEWVTNTVHRVMQNSGYCHGVEYYESLRKQLVEELSKEI